MSNIEEKFFETFEIEPLQTKFDVGASIDASIFEYPNVCDSILVKLICIIGSIYISMQDRETLKEHILAQCINIQMYSKDIKQQVQAIFKEMLNV